MSAPRFVRNAVAADHEAVLAMNNAAVPNVNALSMHEFAWLVSHAAYFRVCIESGEVAGFIICLPAGIEYWSDNYKWFSQRYESFLYLDRVVAAEWVRGQGVGALLYADLHAFAAGRWPWVTLEVNLEPPNPGSVRFHERLGYERVGVREYGGNAVAMYSRAV
jgi:hypothetical protein